MKFLMSLTICAGGALESKNFVYTPEYWEGKCLNIQSGRIQKEGRP